MECLYAFFMREKFTTTKFKTRQIFWQEGAKPRTIWEPFFLSRKRPQLSSDIFFNHNFFWEIVQFFGRLFLKTTKYGHIWEYLVGCTLMGKQRYAFKHAFWSDKNALSSTLARTTWNCSSWYSYYQLRTVCSTVNYQCNARCDRFSECNIQ